LFKSEGRYFAVSHPSVALLKATKDTVPGALTVSFVALGTTIELASPPQPAELWHGIWALMVLDWIAFADQ
jgi:hypothetical protein